MTGGWRGLSSAAQEVTESFPRLCAKHRHKTGTQQLKHPHFYVCVNINMNMTMNMYLDIFHTV